MSFHKIIQILETKEGVILGLDTDGRVWQMNKNGLWQYKASSLEWQSQNEDWCLNNS